MPWTRARTSLSQSPSKSAVDPDSVDGGTGKGVKAYVPQVRS